MGRGEEENEEEEVKEMGREEEEEREKGEVVSNHDSTVTSHDPSLTRNLRTEGHEGNFGVCVQIYSRSNCMFVNAQTFQVFQVCEELTNHHQPSTRGRAADLN